MEDKVKGLDIAYNGAPFCDVINVPSNTLDIAYNGLPFVGVDVSGFVQQIFFM